MAKTTIPLLDLEAQYRPLRAEILAAVTAVCDSQRFVLGPEVESFEAEIAARLGVRHAIGVSSGTDALLVAMMALGVGPDDEVIVPTYSFFATAGCVSRLGARPVLIDIEPGTFNIDTGAAVAAITPRTKAIIPVHLFGQAADLNPLVEAADRHGIAIIEDACQAIGGRYRGHEVGGIGHFGCFSFFPSKNLGGFGDGGLVTTNDDRLGQLARTLRAHGAMKKYHHSHIGGNFRLDALQAAVLRVKLRHLDTWTEGRRRNAERYARLFSEAALDGVVLPSEVPGAFHVFNQYVIRLPDRDRVRAHLAADGIGTEVYYPVPFHLQECFRDLGYARGSFPVAEGAARDSLAIPVFPEMTQTQQGRVVEQIAVNLSEPA
jgi:dTDP-4-amino-4,6-dideoxygalactose transaminase